MFLGGALAAIVFVNLVPARRGLDAPFAQVHGAADPGFAHVMEQLLAPAIREGNRIETLVNGDRIFPAMLGAIQEAERSIHLETYIYWDGESAGRFAEALAERARAGVEVRVLLDWFGSTPTDRDHLRVMRDAGADLLRFRRPRWHSIDRLNSRTHRKLLVVDGRIAFTGGVGIGDKWQGDARNPEEWRETQYRVEGPVVSQMQAAFLENWMEAAGGLPHPGHLFPPLDRAGEIRAQVAAASPLGGPAQMHMAFLLGLAAAERRIRIGTPYFVPDEVSIAQLIEARERGVEVTVLLPGEHINKGFVRRASRHFWGRMLEAGIRIHEYQPTMYHPKLLVVDEAWATIGSANFDERSFRLNDEMNLMVFDAGFAREQAAIFDADIARSREVTLEEWRARPWRMRTGDRIWALLRPQL
nr:phospholipase D-like domain-containing protein [Roseococcus sp. MDT2-1-1]